MEKKKYYVVDLMHVEGIKETPVVLHVVDRVHKKILKFYSCRDCKDVTASARKLYEADRNKPYSERRIGCKLVSLLDGPDVCDPSVILLATDDAREATRRIASVRAYWHSVRAKGLESIAGRESAGWGETVKDDFVADRFRDL